MVLYKALPLALALMVLAAVACSTTWARVLTAAPGRDSSGGSAPITSAVDGEETPTDCGSGAAAGAATTDAPLLPPAGELAEARRWAALAGLPSYRMIMTSASAGPGR